MKRKYRLGVWAICLLLLIALAGCGSAKSSNQSAGSAPSSNEMSFTSSDAKMSGESAANSSLAVRDQVGTAAGGSATDSAVPPGIPASQSLASAGPVPTGPADGFDRKLIYKANVTMEVESYARTQSEVRGSIVAAGGYILQFSEYNTKTEKGGTFVIKVPSDGFFGMIDALEQLEPKSLNRNMQGSDVTEEYVDLESRLKALQVTEARLLEFMGKATRADELVSFSSELGRVQENIERLKGRMRYLDQNVAFSTIELRMFEKVKETASGADQKQSHLLERAWNSMKTSGQVMVDVFAGLLVFAAGAIPVLLVLAVILLPAYGIYRWVRSKQPSSPDQAKQPEQAERTPREPHL
jgi:hypothetical protein